MLRARQASFLFKRESRWYFRLILPAQIRSVVLKREIRVSLATNDVTLARERVAAVLPYVYAIKRLSRTMNELTQDDFKRALTHAVTRLIDALERSREPWASVDEFNSSPGLVELTIARDALQFTPEPVPDRLYDAKTAVMADAAARGNHEGGVPLAHHVLSTLGIRTAEDSDLFKQLSMEMLKLQLVMRRAVQARVAGDHDAEERLISYYRSGAYLSSMPGASSGKKIEDAWREYAAEKTDARPEAAWRPKTAAGQEAMFAEFREILGNVPVADVTRNLMMRYRQSVARVPANRQKRYPGKSVAELLEMQIPENQLPSARTVQEKLVQIGAFLRWCRETKGYLNTDPMAGVHVKAESQSYALFTQEDLKKLFNSRDYERSEHTKSWHFWLPLIALYTGARQTEIAQLATSNVIEEDGVWILAITDQAGADQSVKTRAGIRKVPISRKLVDLGFLEYTAFIKQRGHVRLFPDLRKGKHGWGDKVSRWFNDVYRKKCGIEPDVTGRRKVFHSFRHTAITKALSKSQALLAHSQQVFGHEKSVLGETATYMGPFPVGTLVQVTETLDWGLDHSAYRDAWKVYASKLA